MCEIKDCNIVEVGFTTPLNNTERRFNRNVYIHYNEYFEFFKNHSPIDYYCSAFLYNTQKISEAELYGNLYLDFDDENNINNAREDIIHTLSFFKIVYQIPSDQLRIYFSGNKGFHLVVPKEILGIEPNKNLNGIFKTIAEQINRFSLHKTVDLKIYDNRRLFRVPNSINSKTNLYKIMITDNELENLSINDIYDLAKQPRFMNIDINNSLNPVAHSQYLKAIDEYVKEEKTKNYKNKNFRYRNTLKVMPECIKNILENGAEEGSRNITIACLTSYYMSCGKTLQETIDLINDWNSRNNKPTPYREMIATIKSIFNSGKHYGCSTLRTLTKCNIENCKLKQSKLNRKGYAHAINTGNYSKSQSSI